MNTWYLIALILIGAALLFLVGCLMVVIVSISTAVKKINEGVAHIQQRMNGLQHKMTQLTANIDRITIDVQYKKTAVQSTIHSVKKVASTLDEISYLSRQTIQSAIKKADEDPVIQAQVEQWTNKVISVLHRKKNVS